MERAMLSSPAALSTTARGRTATCTARAASNFQTVSPTVAPLRLTASLAQGRVVGRVERLEAAMQAVSRSALVCLTTNWLQLALSPAKIVCSAHVRRCTAGGRGLHMKARCSTVCGMDMAGSAWLAAQWCLRASGTRASATARVLCTTTPQGLRSTKVGCQ